MIILTYKNKGYKILSSDLRAELNFKFKSFFKAKYHSVFSKSESISIFFFLDSLKLWKKFNIFKKK
jgi:hypothetical protein